MDIDMRDGLSHKEEITTNKEQIIINKQQINIESIINIINQYRNHHY